MDNQQAFGGKSPLQQELATFNQQQHTRDREQGGTYMRSKPQLRALRSEYTRLIDKYKNSKDPADKATVKSLRASRKAANQQITPKKRYRWPKNLARWTGKQVVRGVKWTYKKGKEAWDKRQERIRAANAPYTMPDKKLPPTPDIKDRGQGQSDGQKVSNTQAGPAQMIDRSLARNASRELNPNTLRQGPRL